MPIKKSQRKALSSIIGSGSITIQSIGSLSMRTEEYPEAMTDAEFDYLKRLRSQVHQDSVLMLKFAHKLRKHSNAL